ncbi:unnamed protein product [Ambrosiozyma monospora]|uniref:Unnamed protein product n=1 Tax=Ambrosiozyma monospora TaxID=43982 RepID=A0ACB5TBZ7_AMBMO|nr:unnamed protein product [Ambrosiozyma monospora]
MFSTNELESLLEHIPDCHGDHGQFGSGLGATSSTGVTGMSVNGTSTTETNSTPLSGLQSSMRSSASASPANLPVSITALTNNINDTHLVKKETTPTDESTTECRCLWIDPITNMTCNQLFSSTGELSDHVIENHIMAGKPEYTCHWKDCPRNKRTFTQRQKIVRHLNTHTKHKPFKCPTCQKCFSLESMLEQHSRIHTGEKPYECKHCGKFFKTSSSLTIHSRIHSGVKPMVCNICGKRFNESSNLTKHMRIHLRRFRCDLCLKSFDDEAKFVKHRAGCEKKQKLKQLQLQGEKQDQSQDDDPSDDSQVSGREKKQSKVRRTSRSVDVKKVNLECPTGCCDKNGAAQLGDNGVTIKR